MSKGRLAIGISVAASLLLAAPGRAQDQRAVQADLRLAQKACKDAIDTGSLRNAIDRLNRISSAPGVKALLDSCNQAYATQKEYEDRLLREGRMALDRRAYDEAKQKFQILADRSSLHRREALDYLSQIARTAPAGGSGGAATGVSKQDFDNLAMAKRHIAAKNYHLAKPLLEPLVAKGGEVGADAKRNLDLIAVRQESTDKYNRALQLRRQKRFQEMLNLALEVQQADPGYPGLDRWISEAQAGGATAAPASPTLQAFEQAKTLYNQGDYNGAVKGFRSLQNSAGAPADLPSWIQKAEAALKEDADASKAERFRQNAAMAIKRRDYPRAETELRRALALAPEDTEAQQMLAQTREAMRKAGIETRAEDRSAFLATYLENGVQEFYSGNYEKSSRLLNDYIRENGKHAALAWFFLGAAAGTQFFLTGEIDKEKEAQALEMFHRGIKANPRFQPPRDWVSPKIAALFDRTAR